MIRLCGSPADVPRILSLIQQSCRLRAGIADEVKATEAQLTRGTVRARSRSRPACLAAADSATKLTYRGGLCALVSVLFPPGSAYGFDLSGGPCSSKPDGAGRWLRSGTADRTCGYRGRSAATGGSSGRCSTGTSLRRASTASSEHDPQDEWTVWRLTGEGTRMSWEAALKPRA